MMLGSRLHALAAAAIVAMVAGCVDPPTTTDPPQAERDAPDPVVGMPVASWPMGDCRFAVWLVNVDPERLREFVPEAFAIPVRYASGVEGVGPAHARLGLEAFQCGPEGARIDYASVFARVQAPEHLGNGTTSLEFIKWMVLIDDPLLRESLERQGVAAHAGEVAIEVDVNDVWHVVATMESFGTLTFTGKPGDAQARGADWNVWFEEFTPVADGFVHWQGYARDETSGSGTGVYEVPRGSWLDDLLPAFVGPADFRAGSWTFDNTTVGFIS